MITASKGKLSAVYPALLATIANIGPHIKNLSGAASSKLLQLFASMSAPSFLLNNETNHTLLTSLLESMNAIIEHQYADNATFVYAVLRSSKRFEALRNFTLESGQEDTDRQGRLKKGLGEAGPPKTSMDNGMTFTASPHSRSPVTVEEPMSPGAFAIGDDDDESEEDISGNLSKDTNKSEALNKGAPQSTASSAPSSTRQSVEQEVMPHQIRGMSEKARGKMPMRQDSIASITSLSTYTNRTQSPLGGFAPTTDWVSCLRSSNYGAVANSALQIETWLPHLPLHTIISLISSVEPLIKSHVSQANTPGQDPNTTSSILSIIRNQANALGAIGIESTDIKVHLFEWSTPALGWYESLLWGFIFVSEMDVSKGAVGVWNGTTVKLFRVQETVQEGPSLLAPRGAVDAIGSTLVERLGSVTLRQPGEPSRRQSVEQGNNWDQSRNQAHGERTAVV